MDEGDQKKSFKGQKNQTEKLRRLLGKKEGKQELPQSVEGKESREGKRNGKLVKIRGQKVPA